MVDLKTQKKGSSCIALTDAFTLLSHYQRLDCSLKLFSVRCFFLEIHLNWKVTSILFYSFFKSVMASLWLYYYEIKEGVFSGLIDQFRYFNIQLKTIDIITRLWGINPTNSIVYCPEPRAEIYCLSWILIYRNWAILTSCMIVTFTMRTTQCMSK